jgi:hypothetical protein
MIATTTIQGASISTRLWEDNRQTGYDPSVETSETPLVTQYPPLKYPPELNVKEAMSLNRHERRKLGKINRLKIPSNINYEKNI